MKWWHLALKKDRQQNGHVVARRTESLRTYRSVRDGLAARWEPASHSMWEPWWPFAVAMLLATLPEWEAMDLMRKRTS